jgi:hypothetical protein
MSTRTGLAVCGGLLALFAAVSLAAVLNESATFDEGNQAVAGWLRVHYGDFRLDFEDPPLWEDWAALPNGRDALQPDFSSPAWTRMPQEAALEFAFATRSLFQTKGVDGVAFVNRSRVMMLVLAVGLGALIALWGWRLGGPVAAVVATTLYALDPNFLGHGPLVKNDVVMALVVLAFAFALWRVGQGLTRSNVAALAAVCGIASVVKFSFALLAPMVVVLLAIRVFAPVPWPMLDERDASRPRRLAVAGGILAAAGVATFLTIWATYDFRFAGTTEAGVHLNTDKVLAKLRSYQVGAAVGVNNVHRADVAGWKPDAITQVMQFALAHQLLPEAWVDGFLFTYATSILRTSYLLGESRETGWWYYFPVAIALKTPLATLTALGGTLVLGLSLFRRRPRPFAQWWSLACVAVPPVVYLASAMTAHMNIGLRHILPIYPFAYVAAGVVAEAALRAWGSAALYRIAALAVALCIETATAAPHFIAFFNVAAGGWRNGINLLSDSNLDWGQDLPLLAKWQQAHHDVHLYLSYFGMVDPHVYGIKYRALPGNFQFGPPVDPPPVRLPAVFAISANHIQGFSVGSDISGTYAPFRHRKPREVLGGSIYLFDVPDEETLAAVAPQK